MSIVRDKMNGFDKDTIDYLIRKSLTWTDLQNDKTADLKPIHISDIDTFFLKSLGKVRILYWIRIGEIRSLELQMDKYTETNRMLNLRKLGI